MRSLIYETDMNSWNITGGKQRDIGKVWFFYLKIYHEYR